MKETKVYPKGARGFASMDPAKHRAIASAGGKAVRPQSRSFAQDRALAAKAGRKGGTNVAAEDRSFSKDRKLAARAGRKGGKHGAYDNTGKKRA